MSHWMMAGKFMFDGMAIPNGVRLVLSHGNGFAANAYFSYWQYLLADFDLVMLEFRNHGQNVPVVPPHNNYEQFTRDLQRVLKCGSARGELQACFIRCRHGQR